MPPMQTDCRVRAARAVGHRALGAWGAGRCGAGGRRHSGAGVETQLGGEAPKAPEPRCPDLLEALRGPTLEPMAVSAERLSTSRRGAPQPPANPRGPLAAGPFSLFPGEPWGPSGPRAQS